MQTITNGASALFTRGALIHEGLGLTTNAIAYQVGEQLAARFPDRAILGGEEWSFNIESFAAAGLCELRPHPAVFAEITHSWLVEPKQISSAIDQAWLEITWEGQPFEVLQMSWESSCGQTIYRWLIAATRAQAEAFFSAVCAYNSDPGESIMVFQDGYWQKSHALFQAIKGATLENLVLGGTLKQDLHGDLAAFFVARPIYERAGIPWKRGIVLIGPPGNGKTHMIKALINTLGRTCLYVKSFTSQHADEHHNIRVVFNQARDLAPCILVLEDLDSLITDHNRSFFLNELDGFASNEGIVVIASTNHPERLDPAIMARPSRFDRKYHFGLPEPAERQAFLELWATRLDAAMCPGPDTIAELAAHTDGFSFAYLKELLVGSTVRWAERQEPGTMDAIMRAQLVELRAQMQSA